jgi:phage-related minor tail protein
MAEEFGINLDGIVLRNRGEVLPMIKELAVAMQGLGGLEEQKLLSAIFGKFQYARIGALMKNIRDDSSQAARAMDLMGMSAEDLAKTAEQELAVVENAVSTKFTAALERAKVAIAPIGEQFLKAVTPILDFLSSLFEKFNGLSDNVKNAFAIILANYWRRCPSSTDGYRSYWKPVGKRSKVYQCS